MMIRKSRHTLMGCVALLAGGLVACGGSGSEASSLNTEKSSLVRDGGRLEKRSADKDKDRFKHTSRVKQRSAEVETFYYDGRVGTDDVTVRLTFKDNQVSGLIVSELSGVKLRVTGSLDGDGNIRLTAFSQSVKVGSMVGTRHRRKRRFSGDYYNTNGEVTSFRFSKTSAPNEGDDIYR